MSTCSSMLVPFRIADFSTFLRAWDKRNTAAVRLEKRWATVGVLVSNERELVSSCRRGQWANNRRARRIVQKIQDGVLPVTSDSPWTKDAHTVDATDLALGALDDAVLGQITGRGDCANVLLQPFFDVYQWVWVVDPWAGKVLTRGPEDECHREALRRLGSLLGPKSTFSLCCARMNGTKSNWRSSIEDLWNGVARLLCQGGAPESVFLELHCQFKHRFTARFHDRFLLFHNGKKSMDKARKVVGLGPGIQVLVEDPRREEIRGMIAPVDPDAAKVLFEILKNGQPEKFDAQEIGKALHSSRR
jgi:hypothetical protein